MKESKALIEERIEEEVVIVVEEEVAEAEEAPEAQPSMAELLEEEGLDIDMPKSGELREGAIATVTNNEILVSIGAKFEGVIAGKELDQIDTEIREGFEVGGEITVYVLTPEDRNGNLAISYNRAQEELDWEFVEKIEKSGEIYKGTVSGFNKGGLLVPIGQLRGFVPGSQISMTRHTIGETPEKRWAKLVGEDIEIQVIEVDRSRRRLIISERRAKNETRETLKERLLEKLEVGDICKGRVTSLANFGAFVNIEGADGLVHISEISWDRVKHPKNVLKVGQEVDVKVINIDQERKRIGLSIRQLKENPWLKKVEDLKEGQLVEGTITHLTNFGAFARLKDRDLEGLIHISELSPDRIEHPKEIVSVGDALTLRIINIDSEKFRIGLSIRKVSSGAYIDLDWKLVKSEIKAVATGEEAEDEAPEPDDTPEVEVEAPDEDKAEEKAPSTEEAEDEVPEPEDAPETEVEAPDEDEAEEEAPSTEEAEDEIPEPEDTPEAEAKAPDEDEAEEEPTSTEEAEDEPPEPEDAPEAEAKAPDEDEAEEEPPSTEQAEDETPKPEDAPKAEAETPAEDEADETENETPPDEPSPEEE
ncbi:MAG: S1 RNA-binding domain-containing protein [Chloroflexota bacterium]|nr:S1 RNA-binding domain-containing protein [Chloroflexota bacterium]